MSRRLVVEVLGIQPNCLQFDCHLVSLSQFRIAAESRRLRSRMGAYAVFTIALALYFSRSCTARNGQQLRSAENLGDLMSRRRATNSKGSHRAKKLVRRSALGRNNSDPSGKSKERAYALPFERSDSKLKFVSSRAPSYSQPFSDAALHQTANNPPPSTERVAGSGMNCKSDLQLAKLQSTYRRFGRRH